MTEMNDERIDRAIADAYADVVADDGLKSRTLDAIHAAAPQPQKVSGRATGARAFSRRAVSLLIAACLSLAFIGVGGFTLYRTETAYASIVAQTSVTLGVNRFGTVVSVRVENGGSQTTIDGLNLTGLSYEDAMGRLASSGVLGDTQVDVTVGADGSAQEEQLVGVSESSLADAGCSGTCNGNQYGKTANGSGSGSGSGYGAGQGMGNGAGKTGQGMGYGAGKNQ